MKPVFYDTSEIAQGMSDPLGKVKSKVWWFDTLACAWVGQQDLQEENWWSERNTWVEERKHVYHRG